MTKTRDYTLEERKNIVNRLLAPESISVKSLADETGISRATLYRWRSQLNNNKSTTSKKMQNWSSEDKFHIVIETYALNEADLSAYCRQKGLYVEQIHNWREQCLHANKASDPKDISKIQGELIQERNRSKQLAKELARKEKALAEAAALLVLEKKAQAIWGGDAED